ncbi:hypothetical protein EZV62_018815 [Acer yangbiense]|uniref:phosphoribosyl-ATP diphosphatase n=1 Tax=Acer yangbiense TaxID=1000413 RepID=A0A5C7H9W4_9ROSI|nr:hypothetical protein EZV62_018815 [Acer yangbiense]
MAVSYVHYVQPLRVSSKTCLFFSVGGRCREGRRKISVFSKRLKEIARLPLTTLYSLESTISQRKAELGAPENGTWTKRLLLDDNLLCSKIWEETDEFYRTLEENEGKSRTASEMADVLYDAIVLLTQLQ